MEDYLDKHSIYSIFQGLLTELAVHQPDDPLGFMIEHLKKPLAVPRVILQGPPGAGSKELAARLCSSFSPPAQLLDGEELLSHPEVVACGGDEQGVADKVAALLRDVAHGEAGEAAGWVLCDYPRNRAQARALQQAAVLCDKFIYLNASDDLCARRLADKGVDGAAAKAQLSNFRAALGTYLPLFRGDTKWVERGDDEAKVLQEAMAVLLKKPILAAPRSPLRVVVLGPAGAGKRTQCVKLAHQHGLVHVSVGALIRAEMARNGDYKEFVQPFYESGQLLDDEMVTPLVVARLQQSDCAKRGWVLQGFPRTFPQAQALQENKLMPMRTLTLTASEETSIERLTLRRVDAGTGDAYHMKSNPPSNLPDSQLVQRPLDREEAVRLLLDCYSASQKIVAEFFEAHGAYTEISGEDSKEAVFTAVNHFILAGRGPHLTSKTVGAPA